MTGAGWRVIPARATNDGEKGRLCRSHFLISPLGVNFVPRGELCPLGENFVPYIGVNFVPRGKLCPLHRGELCPLGENFIP
jgi:hypothetical protein